MNCAERSSIRCGLRNQSLPNPEVSSRSSSSTRSNEAAETPFHDDWAITPNSSPQGLSLDNVGPAHGESRERSHNQGDCNFECIVWDVEQCQHDTKSVGVTHEDLYLGPHTDSESVRTEVTLRSDAEPDDSGVMTSYPKDVLSGVESDESANAPIDEMDKDLNSITEAQSNCTSRGDRKVSTENKAVPHNISWKLPPVEKPMIPVDVRIPPKSDVSDLGDREFYANLKATGAQALASPGPKSSHKGRSLQDIFFGELVKVHEEKNGFFPRALISTLVTEDRVYEELTIPSCLGDKCTPEAIRKYAKQICEECPQQRKGDNGKPPKVKSFKKIFVILVLIERTSSIREFLSEDINDLHLPLYKENEERNCFDLRLKRERHRVLKCFKGWTRFQITTFEGWQWTTISPFFPRGSRKNTYHFSLQGSVMLPFTADSRRDANSHFDNEFEGGYSRVFKVDIHAHHHNFNVPKVQNQSFAIKRLISQSKTDFEKEVGMLSMFSDNAHEHLISLLATYEQFKVYYLIFPFADGDLTRYWRDINPKPKFHHATVKWVAKQCEGLASGLLKIHNYHTRHSKTGTGSEEENRWGRHGDLKPENILWFDGDNGGTLKISDFGLAEYSTRHSRSYKPKSSIATSMSYRPPECDIHGGRIGQSYDIWTLGCLYLEFVTWLLGGWDLIKLFEEKRSSFDPMWYQMHTDIFFEFVNCSNVKDARGCSVVGARVKKAVTDFIEELHAHPACTEFLHDFINLIHLDILIVKPNNPKIKGRIKCEELHVKLLKMLDNCQENEEYACKPAFWKRRNVFCSNVEEVDFKAVYQAEKLPNYDGELSSDHYQEL